MCRKLKLIFLVRFRIRDANCIENNLILYFLNRSRLQQNFNSVFGVLPKQNLQTHHQADENSFWHSKLKNTKL